jgi:hypothetical protein
MRITSTFWFMVKMLAGCLTFVLVITWGYGNLNDDTQETVNTIAGVAFILVTGVPIVYILYSITTTTVNEYADGIFEIFLDANDKDLHVFTYHRVTGGRGYGASLRLIQHYLIIADTGKSYYSILFSHSMKSLSGRSGYEGFDSFGKSVLQSRVLKDKLAELSLKIGRTLDLGQLLKKDADDKYLIGEDKVITIAKAERLYTTQLKIVYSDSRTGGVLWQVKI